MIYFDHLSLDKDIMTALKELKINYVFQSIFENDGETVFAREALMRPIDKTVDELIYDYMKEGKLHVLEVATFFGAMQEYFLRGYEEKISLNSFPSEAFTKEEEIVFDEYYGDMAGKGIIEMLEYPYFSEEAHHAKHIAMNERKLMVAMDDYGVGVNDNMDMVETYNPDIVKLDRTLISGIDHIPGKQEDVKELLERFHNRGIMVVAEGVEEKEEFDYLDEIGMDLFQGYYLEMPK